MPIYEYKCNICERIWEEIVLVSSVVETPVCICGSLDVTKLISKTGRPKFTGTGFYETDYPKK